MLKRITVDDLRPGMFLEELCASWMEHPFWRTSFTLKTDADVARIRGCGVRHMWINTEKGVDVDDGVTQAISREQADAEVDAALVDAATVALDGASIPLGATEPSAPSEFASALSAADALCAAARDQMTAVFETLACGQSLNKTAIDGLLNDIATSVLRDPCALISVARLKSAHDYDAMHAVAVCALMLALARQLGLSDEHTRAVGLAGLLHDVGKVKIAPNVLNKPAVLTDAEMSIIKMHPMLGHQMLLAHNVGEIVLDGVLHHHEKIDGSGYPHGLRGDSIGLCAKMTAVADVYDAITSDRPYMHGLNPAEAIRKIAEWSTSHFELAVFHALVRVVGIYPIGTLVRLASDRLAVVIEHHEGAPNRPTVKVVYSLTARRRVPPEVLRLNQPGHEERIVGREDATAWQLDRLDRHWRPAGMRPSAVA